MTTEELAEALRAELKKRIGALTELVGLPSSESSFYYGRQRAYRDVLTFLDNHAPKQKAGKVACTCGRDEILADEKRRGVMRHGFFCHAEECEVIVEARKEQEQPKPPQPELSPDMRENYVCGWGTIHHRLAECKCGEPKPLPVVKDKPQPEHCDGCLFLYTRGGYRQCKLTSAENPERCGKFEEPKEGDEPYTAENLPREISTLCHLAATGCNQIAKENYNKRLAAALLNECRRMKEEGK